MGKSRPEEDLQKAAVSYLNTVLPDDVFFFHVPNQKGTRKTFEARLLKAMGVKPGVADLIFLYDGGAYCIELKAPKAYQTDAQKAFEKTCRKVSVPYQVCKSLEEIEGTLRGWGFPVRARIAA